MVRQLVCTKRPRADGRSVADKFLYEAFGISLPGTTAPTNQSFGFGGNAQYFNFPSSGLIIAWNRKYDPVTGQWISRDRIGFDGGDWGSFYRYVGNNPVMWIDARGLGPVGKPREGTHPIWPPGTTQIWEGLCKPRDFYNLSLATMLACSQISRYSPPPRSPRGNCPVCPGPNEATCLQRMCSGGMPPINCGGPGCAASDSSIWLGYVPSVGNLNEPAGDCQVTICTHTIDHLPSGFTYEAPSITNIQEMALTIIHEMLHCCGRLDTGGPVGPDPYTGIMDPSNPAKNGSRCVMGYPGLGFGM